MRMCKICTLPRTTRKQIDAALYAGVGYRQIAAKYSSKKQPFSHVAVCRHRQHLMPQDVVRRPPPPDPNVGASVLARIEAMIAEFRAIANATSKEQPQWAIAAMKEIMHGLEMIGRMTGEIPAGFGVHFNFGAATLTAEHLEALFENIAKRPATRELFNALATKHLGLSAAPPLNVHFLSSSPPVLTGEVSGSSE